MRNIFKCGLVASLLIDSAGIGNAASIGFNIGNVSIGYSDGYWDNDHHWHRWGHRSDWQHFRAEHRDMYHDWRHDDRRRHD